MNKRACLRPRRKGLHATFAIMRADGRPPDADRAPARVPSSKEDASAASRSETLPGQAPASWAPVQIEQGKPAAARGRNT